jgi:hypothetical protein
MHTSENKVLFQYSEDLSEEEGIFGRGDANNLSGVCMVKVL